MQKKESTEYIFKEIKGNEKLLQNESTVTAPLCPRPPPSLPPSPLHLEKNKVWCEKEKGGWWGGGMTAGWMVDDG